MSPQYSGVLSSSGSGSGIGIGIGIGSGPGPTSGTGSGSGRGNGGGMTAGRAGWEVGVGDSWDGGDDGSRVRVVSVDGVGAWTTGVVVVVEGPGVWRWVVQEVVVTVGDCKTCVTWGDSESVCVVVTVDQRVVCTNVRKLGAESL